jgi:hypothetical protein
LFAAADAALPEGQVRVCNMRVDAPDVILQGLLEGASPGTGPAIDGAPS